MFKYDLDGMGAKESVHFVVCIVLIQSLFAALFICRMMWLTRSSPRRRPSNAWRKNLVSSPTTILGWDS